MEPIKPEDIAYSEPYGALSINAAAVANRLNALLAEIERLERRPVQCACVMCGVGE